MVGARGDWTVEAHFDEPYPQTGIEYASVNRILSGDNGAERAPGALVFGFTRTNAPVKLWYTVRACDAMNDS